MPLKSTFDEDPTISHKNSSTEEFDVSSGYKNQDYVEIDDFNVGTGNCDLEDVYAASSTSEEFQSLSDISEEISDKCDPESDKKDNITITENYVFNNNDVLPRSLSERKLLSVAIYIGATHSGSMLSFTTTPLDIHVVSTERAPLDVHRVPYKMTLEPTSILLNNRMEFNSFGTSAEYCYNNSEFGDIPDWYFFKRFLWKVELLTDTHDIGIVKTEDGQKQISAIKICSMVVKHMMNIVKSKLKERAHLTDEDIQWVLTVPNMWNSIGKQFMLNVTREADISDQNVMIVTESEAAFRACWQLQKEIFTEFNQLEQLKTIIILNCGDITLDITANEVLENYSIQQISAIYEKLLGMNILDEGFHELMCDTLGRKVFTEFCKENTTEQEDIFHEFHLKLYHLSETGKTSFRIKINPILKEKALLNGTLVTTKYTSFVAGHINIDLQYMLDVFKARLNKIVQRLQCLIDENKLSNRFYGIIMVGTVCKIPLFHEMIRNRFIGKSIIIPTSPEYAVIQGAVLSGHYK